MSKQHLFEGMIVSSRYYDRRTMTIQEAAVAVEGTPYKALAVYRFRFTRPDEENVNGRIYTTPLWARIITQFKSGRSTAGLMDHPISGAGSPKDRWCIWRNMDFSDGGATVSADCYILDNEWGRTALATLEAGGEIGLSTSGYGDFLSDGKTVDPDTYELERVADWVEEPSYEIYGKMEDRCIPTAPVNTTIQEGKTTQSEALPLKEKSMKKTLREQRDFEISMKRILESVQAIKDPRERKIRAQESLTFYEEGDSACLEDFKKVAEDADTEINTLLDQGAQLPTVQQTAAAVSANLDAANTQINNLQAQLATITQQYDTAAGMLDEAANFSRESASILEKAISEKNARVSSEDYSKLREYAEKATRLYLESKKQNATLQEANTNLVSRLKTLTESETTRVKAMAERKAQEDREAASKALRESANKRRLAAMEEAQLLENATPSVVQLYEETLTFEPGIAQFRESILSKKTLMEAEKYILDIRSQLHPTHVYEAVQKSNLSLSTPFAGSAGGVSVSRKLKIPNGML